MTTSINAPFCEQCQKHDIVIKVVLPAEAQKDEVNRCNFLDIVILVCPLSDVANIFPFTSKLTHCWTDSTSKVGDGNDENSFTLS